MNFERTWDTPAESHQFDINDNTELLDESNNIFHFLVTKALSIANKRARPDNLLPVSHDPGPKPDIDD